MDTIETIRTRRSIRKYKTDPVDDKALETVLEAARWAPSWANTQCWRLAVVRDSGVKAQLADTMAASTSPAANAIRTCPVVIVACAELGRSGFRRNTNEPATDKGDWFMFDVALAMQNLQLAAHALGLGTVHIGLFDAKRAAAVLQLPANLCVVELCPLGYPDEVKTSVRKELGEIVFYDRWSGSKPAQTV
ncbi:MAG: nitroreductase family protein [Chloroflexi bacterium]|nr:nitroreductase family protein [Chloroflexota bacterium]